MIPFANLKRNFKKSIEQPFYAAKIFFTRGLNYLFYKLGSGHSFRPDAITIFLTYLCNLRCKMCGQWGEAGVFKDLSQEEVSQQLEFSEIKKLINQVAFYRPSITLFGGEPLLHKDFIKVFEYIKGKKLHCVLITNTSFLKKHVKTLVLAGLDELNISLDGPGKVHDDIRGIPGLFDKVRESVFHLNEYKQKRKRKKPLIHIEFTITRDNVDYMLDMVEVAKEFNAQSLSFHHLIFLTPQTCQEQEEVFSSLFGATSRGWKGFILEPAINTGKLIENIRQLKKIKVSGIDIDIYPNIKESEIRRYYNDVNFIPSGYKKRCLSPWMTCYIFPDGGVRPCLNMEYSVGNIKEDKFLKIWNNSNFRNYRKTLKRIKNFAACTRCSEHFRY